MSPENATLALWIAWYATWIAAVVFSGRTKVQLGRDVMGLHRALAGVGVVLLFWPAGGFAAPVTGALWPESAAVKWGLFALTVAGFAFCWWARLRLGRLWSGFVTLKEDHHIVDTGPYGLVRHPIYSGVMFAALMTALMKASPSALAGFALVTVGFWLTARIEEAFLRGELGAAAYDAYSRRVGMLLPGMR